VDCKQRLQGCLCENLVPFEVQHHPRAITAISVLASRGLPTRATPTGNAQNLIDFIQYGSTADDFEFDDVNSSIDISPGSSSACDQEATRLPLPAAKSKCT
jgi:hypothetical protein